jgi:hypothetical protein
LQTVQLEVSVVPKPVPGLSPIDLGVERGHEQRWSGSK